MNLQISVVLLFISLSGGYSLKCYSCTSETSASCEAKEETCAAGFSGCASIKVKSSTGSSITKGCIPACESPKGTATVSCCDTDLCNAADGVYKGSFLLLVSPLLFYFLFQ